LLTDRNKKNCELLKAFKKAFLGSFFPTQILKSNQKIKISRALLHYASLPYLFLFMDLAFEAKTQENLLILSLYFPARFFLFQRDGIYLIFPRFCVLLFLLLQTVK
jgi:hypothetical protein